LSYELRNAETDDLQRRRWIVGLSLFGAAMGALVSLYQVGILRRLPDPPGGLFNATKVDASNYAYKRLDAPDGLLMTLTYAVTALLAGAGGMDRSRSRPWLPLAMAGKAAYDAATTVKLGREEWRENKALCQYCQAATLASFAILALAVPEAISAVRTLAGRR
jgi:uncharacterized membrane protein